LEAIRKTDSVKSVVIITTDKVYENKKIAWAYRETNIGGFDQQKRVQIGGFALTATRFRRNGVITTARAGNVIGGGDWSERTDLPDVFRSLIFGRKTYES